MAGKRKLPVGITYREATDRYRVRVTYEGKQYEYGAYDGLELAKAALQQARLEIITRTFIPPRVRTQMRKERQAFEEAQQITLRDWSEQWLADLEASDRSPATLASYRSTLNAHILPALGDKNLVEITEDEVTDLVTRATAGGRKPGAGKNAAVTLRAMLNAAIEQGVGGLESNPVPTLAVTASRPRDDSELPTLAEVKALTEAMGPKFDLAVDLAAFCQLRLGEVLGLQRRDVLDLDTAPRLRIERQWQSKGAPAYTPPKDESYRTIAIPAHMVPRLKEHLDLYVAGAPEAPLFASPHDPMRPFSHSAFTRRWQAARKTIRPDLEFHALRHFGLTLFAQQGATVEEIMRRGGHRDPEVAQRYQHSSLERDRELTARMNAVLNPPRKKKRKKKRKKGGKK